MRKLRIPWNTRTKTVSVLCAVALIVPGLIAAHSDRFTVSAPPSVCGLIRPAFFDVLTPGHGTLDDGHRMFGSYDRVSGCGSDAADGTYLDVNLSHIGRGPAGDPVRQTKFDMAQLAASPVTAVGPRLRVAVGEEAEFVVIDNGTGGSGVEVWLVVRVGTYLFWGDYGQRDAHGLTVDSAAGALLTVADEVLAQL